MNFQKIKERIERGRLNEEIIFRPLVMVKDFIADLKNLRIGYYKPTISHKKRFIYFWISKNATTSLNEAIYKIIFRKKGETTDKINKELPRIGIKQIKPYMNYFKFAFVRNPYERILSTYFNQLKNPTGYSKQKFQSGKFYRWKKYKEINKEMSFNEFVKAIYKIPDKKSDDHFRSQYTFIVDEQERLIPDFIGKFENLEKDYKKVMKKIGLKNPPELPKKNKTKERKNYRDYYDEETKKLVEERYKKDLELFNYKF